MNKTLHVFVMNLLMGIAIAPIAYGQSHSRGSGSRGYTRPRKRTLSPNSGLRSSVGGRSTNRGTSMSFAPGSSPRLPISSGSRFPRRAAAPGIANSSRQGRARSDRQRRVRRSQASSSTQRAGNTVSAHPKGSPTRKSCGTDTGYGPTTPETTQRRPGCYASRETRLGWKKSTAE